MHPNHPYPPPNISPPLKPNSVGFIPNPHPQIAREFGFQPHNGQFVYPHPESVNLHQNPQNQPHKPLISSPKSFQSSPNYQPNSVQYYHSPQPIQF